MTLEGWDARESEATDKEGRYNPRQVCAHPIMIINFAREMGLYGLMPSAFYDLCRYGPSKIVSGIPIPENMRFLHRNQVNLRSTFQENASFTTSGIREKDDGSNHLRKTWLTLSPSDLHMILIGREAAQRSTAAFVESQLTSRSPSPSCHNLSNDSGRICRESFYFILLNVLRSVGGISAGRDADPLFTLNQAVEMMSREDFSDGNRFCALKICSACRSDFAKGVERIREEIWEQIPKWFGLQSLIEDHF